MRHRKEGFAAAVGSVDKLLPHENAFIVFRIEAGQFRLLPFLDDDRLQRFRDVAEELFLSKLLRNEDLCSSRITVFNRAGNCFLVVAVSDDFR